MKRIFTILLAAVTVMSCGNNPQNSAIQKTESITMNLYYTGWYQLIISKIIRTFAPGGLMPDFYC